MKYSFDFEFQLTFTIFGITYNHRDVGASVT